jgi:hypothetical protein
MSEDEYFCFEFESFGKWGPTSCYFPKKERVAEKMRSTCTSQNWLPGKWPGSGENVNTLSPRMSTQLRPAARQPS